MADQDNFNQNNQAGGQPASPYSYNTQYTGGAQIGDASRVYNAGQGQNQGGAPAPQGWYCSNCGAYQTKGAFCGSCGTPRSGATTQELMGGAGGASSAGAPFAAQPQEQYRPYETPQLKPENPNFGQPYVAPSAPGANDANTVPTGKAIASLLVGILAFANVITVVLGVVLSIVGLVLAGSFKKQGGKHGAATAGKVLCIVSLVLSLLWGGMVAWTIAENPEIVEEAITLAQIEQSQSGSGTGSGTGSSSGSSTGSSTSLAVETQVKAVVAETLGAFASPSDRTIATLASDLSASQVASFGFTFEEMGIDPTKLAKWELDGFQYKIDRVVVSSDGKSATAFATVKMRDLTTFHQLINQETAKLDESSFGSVAELYRAVGDIWDEASEKVSSTTGAVVVPLVKKNGSWALDQESWNAEYRRMFAI